MGNEQTQGSSPAQPFEYESVILVRGSGRSGKSTLVSRMRGRPFDPSYSQTPAPLCFSIPWKSDSGQAVNLKVWDVPESYFAANPRRLRDPAAAETLRTATGLVVLIDSRDRQSVKLCGSLLSEAPETLQIVVFSNFADEPDVAPLIPEPLRRYIGCFYFIPGSLKTNRGLIELSKWIRLPLIAAKRQMYADKFRAADGALRELSGRLTAAARSFESDALARAHMPALRSGPPERAGGPDGDALADAEFWAPGRREKAPPQKRRRQQPAERDAKPPVRRQQPDARAEVLPRADYDTL
jgi:hypothetical protein